MFWIACFFGLGVFPGKLLLLRGLRTRWQRTFPEEKRSKPRLVHNQRCFCQHLPLSLSTSLEGHLGSARQGRRARGAREWEEVRGGGCRLLSSPGEARCNNSDLPSLPNTHSNVMAHNPFPSRPPPATGYNKTASVRRRIISQLLHTLLMRCCISTLE